MKADSFLLFIFDWTIKSVVRGSVVKMKLLSGQDKEGGSSTPSAAEQGLLRGQWSLRLRLGHLLCLPIPSVWTEHNTRKGQLNPNPNK